MLTKLSSATTVFACLWCTGAHADLRNAQVLECRVHRSLALEWKETEPKVSDSKVDQIETVTLDQRRRTARVKGKPNGLSLLFTSGEGLAISGENFTMLIADDPNGREYRMVVTSSMTIAANPAAKAAVGGDILVGTCKEVR